MRVRVRPRGSTRTVHAVKGMFVQVLENLLTNSVFWVAQRHRHRCAPASQVRTIPRSAKSSSRSTQPVAYLRSATMAPESYHERRGRVPIVLQHAATKTRPRTRPFIAREIAECHGGALYLGDADQHGQIHSIIFEIGGADMTDALAIGPEDQRRPKPGRRVAIIDDAFIRPALERIDEAEHEGIREVLASKEGRRSGPNTGIDPPAPQHHSRITYRTRSRIWSDLQRDR